MSCSLNPKEFSLQLYIFLKNPQNKTEYFHISEEPDQACSISADE